MARSSMTFRKGDPRFSDGGWLDHHGHWRDRLNGRKFGLKYGHKGGKARWAQMSQAERELVWAKRDYQLQQTKRIKEQTLRGTAFTTPKALMSKQDVEDFDEFFGTVI